MFVCKQMMIVNTLGISYQINTPKHVCFYLNIRDLEEKYVDLERHHTKNSFNNNY
jgi:hypothetical protein